MAFIRQSKVRHVFGETPRKEMCYEGFRVTNCAFEGTFIAANAKFVASCIEVGGGGAFIVVPVGKAGRLDANLPKVSAHKEYILDMQWNPYNDNMLATCSEDGSIKLWDIPDIGILMNMDDSKALLALEYHERRCVQIAWHPIASNVLLSVSQEPKICIWNLDDGVAEVEIAEHPDIIWNASWSMKGDKIVTSCKDKKFRVFNARTGDLLVCNRGHEGSKAQRIIFTFDDRFLFSTGFSKMSERQYAVWSPQIEELNLAELDTANGCLIPYYDPDTQMVYIAAKGDSVIRYYELSEEEPFFYYISTFQAKDPQRGLAHIQKRSCNPNTNEVFRFYKLCQEKTGTIQPVSFVIPRKSDLFQDDIYPKTISSEAVIEASEWFEGKDAEPNRVDMITFFTKKAPKAASGGLKKGGLKGLKAKKDKEFAKSATSVAPVAAQKETPTAAKAAKAETAPQPSESVSSKVISTEKTSPRATLSGSDGGVDPKVLKELQNDINNLKDNERKLKDDQKKMQSELKSLHDKMKDYDKLTGDIKLLCDAVKKNDERILALESLVQEESDGEDA